MKRHAITAALALSLFSATAAMADDHHGWGGDHAGGGHVRCGAPSGGAQHGDGQHSGGDHHDSHVFTGAQQGGPQAGPQGGPQGGGRHDDHPLVGGQHQVFVDPGYQRGDQQGAQRDDGRHDWRDDGGQGGPQGGPQWRDSQWRDAQSRDHDNNPNGGWTRNGQGYGWGNPGWGDRGDRDRRFDPRWFPREVFPDHHYRWRGGWGYQPGFFRHHWVYGEYLPWGWWGAQWLIDDYDDYDLPPPPWGYEWVRVGGDAILIDVDNGLVVEVVPSLFY